MSVRDVGTVPTIGDAGKYVPERRTVAQSSGSGSAEEDTQEQENRRRHERLFTPGLQVLIDGRRWPVADVSIGGFKLKEYDGPLTEGADFKLVFRVVLDGFITEFSGLGTVTRRAGEKLIAVYRTGDPGFYRQLSRYIEHGRQLSLSYGDVQQATPSKSTPKPAFVAKSV